MDGVTSLPIVDRIQGAKTEEGTADRPRWVDVQYTDHTGQWHELRMPFLGAMYLLNILRAIQLDVGFESPPDPRL